jgi:hypothetical protein
LTLITISHDRFVAAAPRPSNPSTTASHKNAEFLGVVGFIIVSISAPRLLYWSARRVVVQRFTQRHDIPQSEITAAWLSIASARPRATGLQSCPARIKTVVQASNVQINSKYSI